MMPVCYKMRQILLQNATATFLQNVSEVYHKMYKFFIKKCDRFIRKCDRFIRKCDSYYKLGRLYYKVRQLLQNATFVTLQTVKCPR